MTTSAFNHLPAAQPGTVNYGSWSVSLILVPGSGSLGFVAHTSMHAYVFSAPIF